MFGLAIWDVRGKKLVLARDPFGIKLIYYRLSGERLYFGSEVRAVIAGINERPDADPDSVNLFLRYRFTPSPHTIFRGVQKLAPGTKLVCQGGSARVSHWYNYRPTSFSSPKSDGEVRDDLVELYKQSVRRHLLSDVPVGLLLSGGIDSSLLLALMNLYGSSWRTYTVGYGASFLDDELVDAERTASQFSSQHSSVLLDRQTFEQALPAIVSQLEEPVAASSIVPMYFVCQRARQDVKVALVGQGPDELFGGYRRHLGVRYGSSWGSIPAWMRAPIEAAIAALPRNETLKRGLHSLSLKDRTQRYQQVLSLLPQEDISQLFRDGMLHSNADDELIECWKDLIPLSSDTDELGGFQFLEMRSTLPDELLMYGDKLSMAHGLEVRVPYLDKEIVEYVERLPAHFKVRYGTRKWAHREVCKQLLPNEILKRKKRGFAANVVDDWFRGAVSTQMKETLLDSESMIYRYLRPAAVQRLFQDHQSGKNDYHKILFSLMVFETWLRVHFAQDLCPA
jgi:asparagine synthase (glutamine-hydrolysing)